MRSRQRPRGSNERTSAADTSTRPQAAVSSGSSKRPPRDAPSNTTRTRSSSPSMTLRNVTSSSMRWGAEGPRRPTPTARKSGCPTRHDVGRPSSTVMPRAAATPANLHAAGSKARSARNASAGGSFVPTNTIAATASAAR